MKIVDINILGISGTDIKDGNCDTLVKEALKGAEEIGEEVGGVETEFVTLADKEIERCKHCQWCIENRAPCKVQDDFYLVYEKLKKCDGFILGAPSWFRTCGPRIMEFWSRLRFSVFFSNELRNKVGGAVSLGFFGYGVENTLDVQITTFIPPWNSYDMNTVRVLEELGFQTISADGRGIIKKRSPLKFRPERCGPNDIPEKVESARRFWKRRPVVIPLFHAFEFSEVDRQRGNLTYQRFDNLLAWISSQKDICAQAINQL